jgi:colanic acid biosynthesis glycosyl transferase WcaI
LKVLIVGLNYAPEPIGIGPYTTGLAEYLAGAGHRVEVVAGRPYYPQWRAYAGFRLFGWRRTNENGVGVTRCWHYVPRVPGGIKRILHHFSFLLTALPAAIWRAFKHRPDAVLCVAPSIMSAYPARLAAALSGARMWLHLQDFEVDAAFATGMVTGPRLARLLLAAERGVLRSAAVVSTISPQMVARLVEKGGAADRTYQLRNWANAVPGESTHPGYREEWSVGSRQVLLYSGNLGAKQGAGLIVEAARLLATREDLLFLICGEGPELAKLQAQADGLGNLRFHPLQPAARLMELLELAAIHLLPQLDAAADLVLPSKLTNMLLSGRPVIATALPGTGLFDEVEGCGIAIPPGDADMLAAAILRLADNPALSTKLGAAARIRAAQRWSHEAILSSFERRLVAMAEAP